MSNVIHERDWGHWEIIAEKEPKIKIKELVIEPGGALSFQKHNKRNEHWFILQGKCTILTQDEIQKQERIYGPYETCVIPKGQWHQASNTFDEPCHILEVQYGEICVEEDIERRHVRF